ncbi:MAG: flagellar assembly peptidoglycan hydrolase FlgJ [Gammaproteobacteria bacterium]|nr:flagellar assembly peptidoglycan hydrolase FlgJ [Gammaproteobacteria bacterium]
MQLDMAQVYTDFSGLAAMRARARDDQDAALDEVARQFESLFLQMTLKSMRDASFGGGLLDSKQSEFYREMYDKQIAMTMTEGQGIGLADVIKRQLGGAVAPPYQGLQPQEYLGMPIVARPAVAAGAERAEQTPSTAADLAFDGDPETFLEQLWPAAEQAAAELGLAPEALLAQAALETGWGRHVMRQRGGDSSHNLFGIKADRRWHGDRVPASTLEYRDGVALNTRADFRAYESFEHSLADYVEFVQRNPRYREALGKTDDPAAYFDALQRAGYATDPAYADKIQRILDSEPVQRMRQRAQEGSTAT